jgi:hypothetical protein
MMLVIVTLKEILSETKRRANMKTKFCSVIALFAIIIIGIIACNNGDNGNGNTTEHVHDWSDWQVTTPATCTTAGVETRTCKLDVNHTDTQAIAELGHDWGEWVVTTPPTTTAEGVETRTCKHDATHKETQPIDKLEDPTIPRDQTATITNLLDNNSSATVQGYLTNAEWDGIVDKIETAINDRFATRIDLTKDLWRTIFGRGVTIIVEATPAGYTSWKLVGDSKTIYLSLAAINDENLITLLSSAINGLGNSGSTFAKAIQPKHNRVHAG